MKQATVSPAEMASATRIENHTPSNPQTSGSSNTAADWNTSARKKEMAAEIRPLFSAVKWDEP